MKPRVSFDELFDDAKDTESFEIEQLCFEVAHRIAERLRELFEQTGMTQRALAKQLGVSEVYVSRVLRGNPSNLTLATIVRFARALGCRVTAPALVPRESGAATVILGDRAVSRNAPKCWGAAVHNSSTEQFALISSEKTDNGHVTGTAA